MSGNALFVAPLDRHVNDIASGDIAIYIFDRDVDL